MAAIGASVAATSSNKRRMVRSINFVLAVMLRTDDCIVVGMIKYDFYILYSSATGISMFLKRRPRAFGISEGRRSQTFVPFHVSYAPPTSAG